MNMDSGEGRLNFQKPGLSRRNLIIAFVLGFIILFLISRYIYISADRGPTLTDGNALRLLGFYRHYVLGEKDVRHYGDFLVVPYPPLTYSVSVPFLKFLGLTPFTAKLSLLLFSIIFLLSMFGIGYEYGGAWAGAAVMALGASSPHLLNTSSRYFLDFPETSMTALAFYLLLKTSFFKDKKFSLLFGAALALAFLTKWSTVFFILLPIIWFIIPSLFRSWQSISAAALFSLPAGAAFAGAWWFIVNLNRKLLFFKWFKYYLLFVLLPAAVAFGILLLIEKRWLNKGEVQKGTRETVNFGYAMTLFALLAGPWYYWRAFSLKDLAMKWMRGMERGFLRDPATAREFVFKVSAEMFNFLPVLVLIGLIVILWKYRTDLYKRLILPLNSVVIILLMLKIKPGEPRHMLSLLIFAAALGGFWVVHTGRAKALLSGLIIIFSSVSLFAWTFIPGNLGIFREVKPNLAKDEKKGPKILLTAQAPNRTEYNTRPLIESLFSDHSKYKNALLVDVETGFAVQVNEQLQWQAFKEGSRFIPSLIWNYNNIEQDVSNMDGQQWEKMEEIKDVIVFHKDAKLPRESVEKIVKPLSFSGYRTKVFSLTPDVNATLILMEK